MTSTESEAEIVKQDAAGRVRVSPERREKLLEEFEGSGLSGAKFARLAGIKYPTFANWVARRRRQRPARKLGEEDGAKDSRGPIRLFEAVLEGGCEERKNRAGVEGLRIELPGGSRVVIDSPVQLQMAVELVALVAQRMGGRC